MVLDLLLMAVAFAAVRSADAVLLFCSFGLHYLAALTVRRLCFFLISLFGFRVLVFRSSHYTHEPRLGCAIRGKRARTCARSSSPVCALNRVFCLLTARHLLASVVGR